MGLHEYGRNELQTPTLKLAPGDYYTGSKHGSRAATTLLGVPVSRDMAA